jgi:hypothetical protein
VTRDHPLGVCTRTDTSPALLRAGGSTEIRVLEMRLIRVPRRSPNLTASAPDRLPPSITTRPGDRFIATMRDGGLGEPQGVSGR